jgi:hypothetical protein
MKPSIGRIVHFVQAKPHGYGEGVNHLPAIITAVWGPETVNLQVFTDGTNSDDANMSGVKWITPRSLDAGPSPRAGTWHWPEREE